ncbi:MAG: DUF4394 domain-containing protein [Mesorhizobium sp.]|nr:DUF4394 domain-containing protein [Mesorhizobium sp.]
MKPTTRTIIRSTLAGASFIALTAAATAAPAVGLVGDKTLVWFDTDNAEVTRSVEVEGVDSLMGIDVRPSNNMLYGVDGNGMIVTIDLESGAATMGAELSEKLPDGVTASVNFNPVADKLRLMGSDGTNLRIDVETGAATVDGSLNFEAGDANAEATPNVVATAYTNGLDKPEKTSMWDIDASLGALLRQTAPNDGTLATIGMLGIEGADQYAIDFEVRAIDDNVLWLAAGNGLYTVNVESGAATMESEFSGLDGTLRDIAILPAM